MEKEQTQNDLETLSRAWSERIRGIRDTARQKGLSEKSDSIAEVSTDNQQTPETELFTESFVSNPLSQGSPLEDTKDLKRSWLPSVSLKYMFAGFLVIALGLIGYGVFLMTSFSRHLAPPSASAAEPKTVDVGGEVEDQFADDMKSIVIENEQPVSLKMAQDYYDQGLYNEAQAVYDTLIKNLDQETKDEGLEAFLAIKKASCMAAGGDTERAIQSLKKLSQHRLPVVRALSNYSLCLEEFNRKQYLLARTCAYRAIALLDAAGDVKPLIRLRRNCQFLAAEALSRHVLMLLEGSSDLPDEVWSVYDQSELNQLIGEESLVSLLTMGAQELNKATLRPVIDIHDSDSVAHWTVLSKGASLDEIIGRFSASGFFTFEPQIRNGFLSRPIHMYMEGSTGERVLSVAAGCSGLVAAFNENDKVIVYDPVESSYTRDQILRLCDEAVSCWQQFLFTYHDDPKLANVYFLLGVLKAQQGQSAEALGHYKMVANRFYQSKLAPIALIHSAELKTSLNDYAGAYSVLSDAVYQHPDHKNVDNACLLLATAALQIDRKEEAANLFSKVYFINSSPQTRATAALKAGQIHYQNKDYEQAQKWLSRYIELAPKVRDSQYYQAYLFLGLTWQAIGNTKSASEALKLSLSDQLSQEDYLRAVSALVECSMERGSYVMALNALNDAVSRPFSRPQSVSLLLLRSRTLRSMGLIEPAATLLNERQEYLVDELLKAEVGYELSECYIQQRDFEAARKTLMKVLDRAGSGMLAQKAMLQMAHVCFELDQDSQAANMCNKLLDMNPDAAIENQTQALLATIYRKQKNYDHAALSLLGQVQ